MFSYTVKAFMDNGGGYHLFALDGETVIWGAAYRDYATFKDDLILLEDGQPNFNGWEFGELDDMSQVRADYEFCTYFNINNDNPTQQII